MPVETQSQAEPPRITTLQRMMVSGVANGLSIAEAGRQAGIADRRNAWDTYRTAQDRIGETMDKVGLSEWEILARVRELTDADKHTIIVRPGGYDRVESPDNGARIKAIEIAANLRGMLKRDTGVNIGTVNVLWAGTAPPWANGQADRITNANDNSIDNNSVIESQGNAVVPEVQLKVLGSDPGGTGHTHSKTLANRMVKTPNRQVKKRGPRLPVYKGDK